MSGSLGNSLLLLFVINLGIVFGAGIYESRIVVPHWASAPPESLRALESGRRFWVFVSTGPLTLLALANLLPAWLAQGARGDWWLAAALVVLVERILTFTYFIPRMVRLQRADTMPVSLIRRRLRRWHHLNFARHLLILAGWLAALMALSSGLQS